MANFIRFLVAIFLGLGLTFLSLYVAHWLAALTMLPYQLILAVGVLGLIAVLSPPDEVK